MPRLLGSSLLSHARASTRLSNFMLSNSRRRSAPLDRDFELGPQSPKFTPTTTKDSPRVTVADWSSSHPTMVSSLKVDEERAVTPTSFRTVRHDGPGNGNGNHALQSMDSRDELVPSPARSRPHVLQPMESRDQLIPSPTRTRFEHGNHALHTTKSRDELVPTPTRTRFHHGNHALRSMDSQDELVTTPTRSIFEHEEGMI